MIKNTEIIKKKIIKLYQNSEKLILRQEHIYCPSLKKIQQKEVKVFRFPRALQTPGRLLNFDIKIKKARHQKLSYFSALMFSKSAFKSN